MTCAEPLTTSFEVSTPRASSPSISLEQHAEVDDDAVADDRHAARREDAGGQQVQRVLLAGLPEPMTMVCPALLPPLNFTTASTRLPSRSVALPLPSSPHWAPTSTIAGMRYLARCWCWRHGLGRPVRAGPSKGSDRRLR